MSALGEMGGVSHHGRPLTKTLSRRDLQTKSHRKTVWNRAGRSAVAANESTMSQKQYVVRGWRCSVLHGVILVLLLALCQVTLVSSQACSPTVDCHPPSDNLVNLTLPGREVKVSSTCGENNITTEYYRTSQTADTIAYFCNASYPHPEEGMTDRRGQTIVTFEYENPVLQTYWQSLNTLNAQGGIPTPQYVEFNLTVPFLIRKIRIIFIAPHITVQEEYDMRPKAMSIDKWDPVVGWKPLRYFAEKCTGSYPGIEVNNLANTYPDLPANQAVCYQEFYGGDTKTQTGWGFGRQEVLFNPSKDYDPEYANSAVLQRHFMTSALRLHMKIPSDNQWQSSYYAIADLEVDGQCSCFGHSAECTGTYGNECVCEHNTMGVNCEQCKPLYNNKPWRTGNHGKANACEDCGCNGHASKCVYNQAKQYGVCQDCTKNTAGDKCQFCVNQFYVNPDRNNPNVTLPATCTGFNGTGDMTYSCDSWCIPCNCSLEGSLPTRGYNCDNFTGQCYCKQYVMARSCDECRDGYWNLQQSNVQGCQACDCDTSGALGNKNVCDKVTGLCFCKKNTQGNRCDQCKAGTYKLDLNNPEGCTLCNCDLGSSTSLVCPVATGQCPCRPNTRGLTCNDPLPGFYGPSLEQTTFEAEFAPNVQIGDLVERPGCGVDNFTCSGRGFVAQQPSRAFAIIVTAPKTMEYNILLHYETPARWPGVQAGVLIVDTTKVNATFVCSGTTITSNRPSVLQAFALPPAPSRSGAVIGKACFLEKVPYSINMQLDVSQPADSQILIDSVTLVPVLTELTAYQKADNTTKAAIEECINAFYVANYTLLNTPECEKYSYSLMTDLYNGAVGCSCNSVGSQTTATCSPTGGQCTCKANVFLRDCSQCTVDHYGFNTGQGCAPCNCNVMGSVRTACNETGICECKSNVTGIKCNSCLPQHWGLFTGKGCSRCMCDMRYSLNNSCVDSGQCHCKPGVGGLTCDQCLDGFYNLTMSGCLPCKCHEDGSATPVCEKNSGVCTCKAKSTQEKCDKCVDGYYGIGPWSKEGCLKCLCSQHSTNCSSAPGWFAGRVWSTWSLLTGSTAVQDAWTGVSDQGIPVTVEDPSKFTNPDGSTAQFVMRIINNEVHSRNELYYFLATSQYLGDKRSSYGQMLQFSMSMKVPPLPTTLVYPTVNSTGNDTSNMTVTLPPVTVTLLTYEELMVNSTRGDVRLTGKHTSFSIVTKLPNWPGTTKTDYRFILREDEWNVDAIDGRTPTFEEMIQVLSDVKSLEIRAKFYNLTGAETDLYEVMLYYSTRQPEPNALPINNVEQCDCPPQYMGQFCEQCAVGYKRKVVNGGAFTECVPCECNNHQLPALPCQPETGVCNCVHNTTGATCQLCQDGLFGVATGGTPNDCQACSCPGNVVANDVNVFASTCTQQPGGAHKCVNCTVGHGGDFCEFCVDNWYGEPKNPANNGGRCISCKCNGRAKTCNSTDGFCVDCLNNTAGKECDICAPKYFGDALNSVCQECNCTSLGATGDCDHRTGACVCKPNVVGHKCDQCGPVSFNYTSGEGCYPCDCHKVGGIIPDCDVVTGQCNCLQRVTGRRCDACQDTYWNINTITGCDPCLCTLEGTKNTTGKVFGTCDVKTGQCECARPGIIGRTCDHCAKGTPYDYKFAKGVYVGTYPMCELCGECYDNWARRLDKVGNSIELHYYRAQQVWSSYNNLTLEEVEPKLNKLQTNLQETKASITDAQTMVNNLNYLYTEFNKIMQDYSSLEGNVTSSQTHYNKVQLALINSKQFAGFVAVTPVVVKSTSQISLETNNTIKEIENLHRQANVSFQNVQNMTDTLTMSGQNSNQLKSRVQSAMVLLTQAEQIRQTAIQIANPTLFEAEHANNTATLNRLKLNIEKYPVIIGQIKNMLLASESRLAAANSTAVSSQVVANTRKAEMEQHVAQGQEATFSASEAQKASQATQITVDNYWNLANTTKYEMTLLLVEVANGIRIMRAVEAQVITGNSIFATITATTIRPLTDIKAITDQISATTISDAQVTQTFESAAKGLKTAEDALKITQTAAEESQVALEHVSAVQANLAAAKSARNQTEYITLETSSYNTTATNILQNIQQRSTLGQTQYTDTVNSASALEAQVAAIQQCFVDERAKAQVAAASANNARTTTTATQQVADSSSAGQRNVTTQVQAKKTAADTQLVQMTGLEGQLNQLNADLATVNQIADLQNVLNQYNAQKNELLSLEREVDILGQELNGLLTRLETLDTSTTTCIHS